MVYKEVIKRNFSKYAHCYDEYADIQNRCGLSLIEKVDARDFKSILDIGCGTGIYTALLRKRFPDAFIKAVDISESMIEVAKEKLEDREVSFVVGDAEEIDFDEKFDLITSNASFQWFRDLKKALLKYRGFLDGRGLILFSTFGPQTFRELYVALKTLFNKDTAISSVYFLDKVGLEAILKGLFGKTAIEERIFTEEYKTLSEFLNKIKYSGIKGTGMSKRIIWSPKTLIALEKIYIDMFKKIKATYQVIFCRVET